MPGVFRRETQDGAQQNAEHHPGVSGAPRVLKVYDVVRTAHLERAAASGSTILYRTNRYDFDAALAASLDVHRAGSWGTWRWALAHDVDIIEVGEPLMVRTAARSVAAIIGNRIRAVLRARTPARAVSYAIENKDPRQTVRSYPARSRIRWHLSALLVPVLWRSLDRVAFGSRGAQRLYEAWFASARRWPVTRLFEAVPAPAVEVDGSLRTHSVVFLGDLSERKGFQLLVEAWPAVRDAVPDATLLVMGKGRLESTARALADADPRVEVVVDPPRAEIFRALGRSKVVALPSQPTPIWREQVGLPIVEGLSMGCLVVTTTETGLSDWLVQHGHHVVPPADLAGLTEALVAALHDTTTPAEVVASLPAQDGRAAAEAWLWARAEAGER